jgi:hypothetical protein
MSLMGVMGAIRLVALTREGNDGKKRENYDEIQKERIFLGCN